MKVYKDFKEKSKQEALQTYVIVNKVIDEEDRKFVLQQVDESELLGMIEYSSLLHKFERGEVDALDEFVALNEVLFEQILQKLQHTNRNWKQYYERLVQIYKENCRQWYNDYYSQNLDTVIDPNFSYETVIKQSA